jgi:hypothetical protein
MPRVHLLLLTVGSHTERGGVCTFCGAKVALDYKERIAQQAAAAAEGTAAPSSTPDMAFGLTEGEESAATAAAVAFKDRLVEYDRNSAKRTTVIDDQSDYFEIDANAWLTDEVRGKGGWGLVSKHATSEDAPLLDETDVKCRVARNKNSHALPT